MKHNLRTILLALIAGFAGLVVLVGYFIDIPLLTDLRRDFLRWGVLLSSVAIMVGVANLFQVHWRRVRTRQPGGMYSFILILSMIVTLIIAGFFGPTAASSQWIYNHIQVPIEASLLSLLAVVLTYAAVRLLRHRPNLFSFVFVLTALLVLLGAVSMPQGMSIPYVADLRLWIEQILVTSGARGLLIGVGLGTLATGLRVLFGVDRPYGG